MASRIAERLMTSPSRSSLICERRVEKSWLWMGWRGDRTMRLRKRERPTS